MNMRQTMKIRTTRWAVRLAVMSAALAAVTSPTTAAEPVGTSFTYQGQLKMDGVPVDGQADLSFRLYDAETEGTLIDTVGISFIDVVDGLFTVELDFGAAAFDGNARWLEIRVEFPSGESNWTTLSPRQPVLPTPYASTALNTIGVDGHSLDASDGSPTDVVLVDTTGKVRMHKGGLSIIDNAGHGVSMTSETFNFTEAVSEDPVYGYSSSTDTHAFYTSGTRRMVISASGDVGIGMAWNEDPSAKLHIGGTAGVDGLMFPDGTLQTTAAIGGGDSLWSRNGVDIYYTAGDVGIGTSSPQGKLHLAGANANLLMFENGGSPFLALGDASTTVGWLQWSSSNDRLDMYTYGHSYPISIGPTDVGGLFVDTITRAGRVGIGTSGPESMLHIRGVNDPLDGAILTLEANAADRAESGRIRFGESTGDMRGGYIHYDGLANKLHLGTHNAASTDPADDVNAITINRSNGYVGIGRDSVSYPLHIGANTRIDAKVGIGTPPPTNETLKTVSSTLYGIRATSTNSIGAAIFGEATATGVNNVTYGVQGITSTPLGAGVYGSGIQAGVEGFNSTTGAVGVYGHHSSSGTGVYGKAGSFSGAHGVRGETASASGYGGYFTNTSSDGTALYAESAGARTGDATLQVHNTQPVEGMAAYITADSTWATVHARNDGTGEVLWLAKNNTEGEYIVAYDEFHGRRVFTVDADGWTKVSVLEITGGADLSEQFDVAFNGVDVEPGMVVAIDAQNPGKLTLSTSAYDRKVAGVVSGAGGVKPGMLMGQEGTMADGQHPVALTGRVWTWCDATKGPIEPGDMLTTSNRPGHAMKVLDHTKAQGAVIGKAMSSLSEGTGLVLVLIQPQ